MLTEPAAPKKFHTVVWDKNQFERILAVSQRRQTKVGTTIRYLVELGLSKYNGDEADATVAAERRAVGA